MGTNFSRRALAGRIVGLLCLVATAAACGPVYVSRSDGYYASQSGYAATTSDQWSYLDAHGYWATTGRWGRVWVPTANQDASWRPYYYGQWDYTDYGWTWVSSESWGWGPYHYGRWTWHDRHRWVWIPGYTWGPAWVSWRTGGDCVGWAPLGPAGVSITHHTYWVFVPQRSVYRTRVAGVVIRPGRAQVVYNQSINIGAQQRIRDHRGGVTTYNRGPSATQVSTWTRTPVTKTSIRSIPSAAPRARVAPRYGGGASTPRGTPATRATRPAPTWSGARVAPTPATAGNRAPPVPSYRAAPTRPSPSYRPAPTYRAPTYRAPTYRAPTYRPAPSYRGAPPTRAGPSTPSARPAPTYTRPAPTYRPAPTRPAPTYTRPAPSYGRTPPRADSRSTPYRVQPRSSGSSSSSRSSRPVRRTRSAPPSRRAPAPRRDR